MRSLLSLVLVLTLAACAGSPLKSDLQLLQEARQKYVANHPDLPAETRKAIRDGELVKGMTPEQVAASWGPPMAGNVFVAAKGVSEWVWGCDAPHFCTIQGEWPRRHVVYYSRAYFENGKLTGWRQ